MKFSKIDKQLLGDIKNEIDTLHGIGYHIVWHMYWLYVQRLPMCDYNARSLFMVYFNL